MKATLWHSSTCSFRVASHSCQRSEAETSHMRPSGNWPASAPLSLSQCSVLCPNSLGFPKIIRPSFTYLPFIHLVSQCASWPPCLGLGKFSASFKMELWQYLFLFFPCKWLPALSRHIIFPWCYHFYITNIIYSNHPGLLRAVKHDFFGLKKVAIHHDCRRSLFIVHFRIPNTTHGALRIPGAMWNTWCMKHGTNYFGCSSYLLTFTFFVINYSFVNSHKLFEEKVNKWQW